MKKNRLAVLFFIAIGWVFSIHADPAIPPHPEFSADMVILQKNKEWDRGRFYLGKVGGRLEMPKAGQTQIFRYDKDVVWVVMEKQKMVMEMKMLYNALVHYKPAGFTETCSGTETIDGHPAEKCRMTGRFMGKPVASTVWKAKDIGGTVIRTRDAEGNGNDLKNIVKGSQPAHLFEPPADYRKMAMPAGVGDLIKEMSK